MSPLVARGYQGLVVGRRLRLRATLCIMRLVLVLCLAVAAGACGSSAPPAGTPPIAAPSASPPAEARFTGRITDVTFGCDVDASCHLTVDGTRDVS